MRTLKFIVDNQTIRRDPKCDFANLIPGTEKYLRVEFSFSSEWNGFKKTVGFFSAMGKEFPSQALVDGKSCMIPFEVLRRRVFRVRVLGERGETKIITNKLAISQDGDIL